MRKSLLAALATMALMNGCTTTPYAYEPGPAPYPDQGARFVPLSPPDGYRADAYPGRPADRDDLYYGRRPDRDDYRCRSDDPRDCPPPPDRFVEPAPPPPWPGRMRHPAAVAAEKGWRVQLGAFCQQSRATALRARLAGLPALSAYRTYLVIGGGLTRVQAGPLPSAAAAGQLCARVKATGHGCIVKRS